MPRVFLGLGSNVGERERYLERALEALRMLPGSALIRQSSVYETEPVGVLNQPQFLNMAAELETNLAPDALLDALKDIERDLGRTTSVRWGPREIDIDIVYYGDTVTDAERLTIPHRELSARRFVLAPLSEIAPDFTDPRNQVTVAEMLRRCPDSSDVRRRES
jgi:2-amino-4-hydroxy-6-hydroxymethyldihydropteridine diphosphokinase